MREVLLQWLGLFISLMLSPLPLLLASVDISNTLKFASVVASLLYSNLEICLNRLLFCYALWGPNLF